MPFFKRSTDRFIADRLDDLQLDQLASQEPERPVGITFGRRSQTRGDHLRFLLPIEQLGGSGLYPFLPLQSLLKTALHKPLPDLFHRLTPAAKGLGNAVVRPTRTVRVGLQ